MAPPSERVFEDFATAAAAMVADMAEFIREHDRSAGPTVLAVGGGRTPEHVLPLLAASACPWQRVTVTLTDDRLVPADDPLSNAGLARRCLLRGAAARADFSGLADASDAGPPQPDIVYLGFGEDGHVASLFPGGPELEAGHSGVVAATAPVAPHRRLSLTLPTLTSARLIVMLVSGAAKHRIYRRARAEPAPGVLPLARVLHASGAAVQVYLDGAA